MQHLLNVLNLDTNELPHLLAGVCLEVHRQMGPGLPAAVYRDCLARELRLQEFAYSRDQPLPIFYRGEKISSSEIVLDFVVEDSLLVMVFSESFDEFEPRDLSGEQRQLETYLRLAGLDAGLWVNFNVEDLRTGMHRLIVTGPAEFPGLAGPVASRN